MELLTNIITAGAAVTLGLTILAKLLPNDKVYDLGFSVGEWLNGWGTARIGSKSWERVEDFLTNSTGMLLSGMRDGLNEGEDEDK